MQQPQWLNPLFSFLSHFILNPPTALQSYIFKKWEPLIPADKATKWSEKSVLPSRKCSVMFISYLQVGIKPGQLVWIPRRQALYQFLGMSEVRQPFYWRVVLDRVVASTQFMVHHGLHAHRVPSVTPRMEGTITWVWGSREWMEESQGKQSSC